MAAPLVLAASLVSLVLATGLWTNFAAPGNDASSFGKGGN
jgi:hypothetical protein